MKWLQWTDLYYIMLIIGILGISPNVRFCTVKYTKYCMHVVIEYDILVKIFMSRVGDILTDGMYIRILVYTVYNNSLQFCSLL